MKRVLKSGAALLALLLACTAVAASSQHGDPPSPGIDRAIEKALVWLDAHPASVADHEVVGVVEEIMFFYALSMNAGGDSERARYHAEIAARHEAIVPFNVDALEARPHLQGTWAPLTYPPLTHIISRTGLESASYRAVIDDMVSAHPAMYPPRDAMQLWIGIYMQRLGYAPDVSLEALLERSALQQDPDAHTLLDYLSDDGGAAANRYATVQLIYDITHEILARTDFGALRPPVAMTDRRDHYAVLLNRAIRWATHASAIDVLAELVFCAHLLGLPDLPSLADAVALILQSQQEDGSFGITNPDRRNGKRHGALTCTLALMTVRASAVAEPR